MDGEIVSTALMLCLDKVAINHNKEVAEAQHKGFQLLIDEAWKVAMRSQHYLTELFKHYKFDEARGYLSVDEIGVLPALTTLLPVLSYVFFIFLRPTTAQLPMQS
ncbi:hypothetical protein L917_14662 [Phytophthora nicotianae]|uniref:Uncharacterized protein n=1 Tax=Phytophthora nicotianae TaxID=4792 RepID=W2KL05_PHYNI|nr:hypothetical protein L917_14662 [Phytophthora nicotianae]